jgi:hypothetical protein
VSPFFQIILKKGASIFSEKPSYIVEEAILSKTKKEVFMTEKEFWVFLSSALEKGRVPQISGYIDTDNALVRENVKYISGHSILFAGHDKLSDPMIRELGELMFNPSTSLKAKEAIMLILAHSPTKSALEALKAYNRNPDHVLSYFAQCALDECKWWNK